MCIGKSMDMGEQLKRFQKAQHYYPQALEKTPSLIEVQRSLTKVYAEVGAFPNALKIILKAVNQAPNSVHMRTSCGNILKRMRNFQEAIKYSTAVVKMLPDESNAKTSLGNCLTTFGDFEQAIALLTEASERSINNANTHYDVALVYYEASYFDLVTTCLIKTLELAPEHINARVLLSKCDKQQGGTDNIEAMKRLLSQSSAVAEFRVNLAYALENHYEN